MTELERLDLSFNKNLQNFQPATYAAMKELKVLILSPSSMCWNENCDIKELPAELGAMEDLERLKLCFNKNLHNLPPAACAGMKAELGAMEVQWVT
jgi:hypothetical protein